MLVFAQGPSIWPSNQFAAEGSRLSSTVDAGSAKLGSRIVAGDQPASALLKYVAAVVHFLRGQFLDLCSGDRYMIQNIAME